LLKESIELAKDLGALSWRLRSTNDLARLWLASSRGRDARIMLQAVYGEFSEGFETQDLAVARQLLFSQQARR